MGKSDPHVFNFWAHVLANPAPGENPMSVSYGTVGFFGQPAENEFSTWVPADKKHFYDLQLNNWEINSFPYDVKERFDLIACTRCPYFSKYPTEMLSEFRRLLKPGGVILIDWAVGDHWRFDEFAVGWKHHGYHEFAYHEENFLWSCYLSERMKSNELYKAFEQHCEKFGYDDMETAIHDEVPVIVTPTDVENAGLTVDKEAYLLLWPDSPAFYTLLLLSDRDK